MPRKKALIPSYLHHKSTGQARIRWQGVDHYLGAYNSPESRAKYAQMIAEIQASGSVAPPPGSVLSVAELVERYSAAAKLKYERKKPSVAVPALGKIKRVLGIVVDLYGNTPAKDFGPVKLAAVRAEMVKAGWCRGYINKSVDEIRRCWRWACGTMELVPGETVHRLEAFPPLERGESSAPESDKVRPVPEAHLAATLPRLSRIVRAMVEIQLLTGMRTTEILRMRPMDIDRSGAVPQPSGASLQLPVWTYRPAEHKNDWRGSDKVILIGPQAQAVLAPFLERDPSAWCFSPAEAVAESLAKKRKGRGPALRGRYSSRGPGRQYTVFSYRTAILRACQAAGVKPEWSPRQLRKNAATRIGAEFGPDVARIVLGHADLGVTRRYLFDDLAKAAAAMLAAG